MSKLKRGTVILIIIALVLAGAALAVNLIGEDDVPVDALELQINDGSTQVGVNILPNDNAEDKLAGDGP